MAAARIRHSEKSIPSKNGHPRLSVNSFKLLKINLKLTTTCASFFIGTALKGDDSVLK